MLTKEEILSELKAVAQETGTTPGQGTFAKKTGIRRHEWYGKYGWRNWGDLVADAGLEANSPPEKISNDQLCEALYGLTEELGAIPSMADLNIRGEDDPSFPARQTITKRLGSAHQRAVAVLRWAEATGLEGDTVELFRGASRTEKTSRVAPSRTGWVYLMKQGQYHKLGKTNDTVRRGKELGRQAAEETTEIHAIETDDHHGLEKYWEDRWTKRGFHHRGEFYKLPSQEVASFRRMKHL